MGGGSGEGRTRPVSVHSFQIVLLCFSHPFHFKSSFPEALFSTVGFLKRSGRSSGPVLTARGVGAQPLPPAFLFHAKAAAFGVEGGAGSVLAGGLGGTTGPVGW